MGLFKKDPLKKLEKEHKRLLEESFKMSKIDRAKSDQLVFEASEIEKKILALKGE